MPARVLSITPATVLHAALDARRPDAPLLTPLQLQTWASSASSATPTSAAGRAEVEQQLEPLLGQRQAAVERLHQERDLASCRRAASRR